MENCVVSQNVSGLIGGGIAAIGSDLSLVNCTIAHNVSEYGAGLYSSQSGDFTVTNSIFWGDETPAGGGERILL